MLLEGWIGLDCFLLVGCQWLEQEVWGSQLWPLGWHQLGLGRFRFLLLEDWTGLDCFLLVGCQWLE